MYFAMEGELPCSLLAVLFRFVDQVGILFRGGSPRNQEAWSR